MAKSKYPFNFGIHCPRCGSVELEEREYEKQLMQSDDSWNCPKCKSRAEWDDNSLATSE